MNAIPTKLELALACRIAAMELPDNPATRYGWLRFMKLPDATFIFWRTREEAMVVPLTIREILKEP